MRRGKFNLILIQLLLLTAMMNQGCLLLEGNGSGYGGMTSTADAVADKWLDYIARVRNATCVSQGQTTTDYGSSIGIYESAGYYYSGSCDNTQSVIEVSTVELSKFNSGFAVYNNTIYEQYSYKYASLEEMPVTEVFCNDSTGTYELILQDFNGQRLVTYYRQGEQVQKILVTLSANTATEVVYDGPPFHLTINRTTVVDSKYPGRIDGPQTANLACRLQNL